MRNQILLILLLVFTLTISYSQDVPYNVSNTSVYDFLDELANCKVIDLNSAIKPYSRGDIALKLKQAYEKRILLTERQKKDLFFYLKEFSKELDKNPVTDYLGKGIIFDKSDKDIRKQKRNDLFFYRDSLFRLSINPIIGVSYSFNEAGEYWHRWNGADAFGYVGTHWGFYASLRDNRASKILAAPEYLTSLPGTNEKGSNVANTIDYEDMRGGLTYKNSWASIGAIKDDFIWGDNYNGSNIFSGREPSVAQIYLKIHPVKWFEFNYITAWLASDVVDSQLSYNILNENRPVYVQKHLTANMFTFTPFKNFNFSIGNSIIFTDEGSNIAYYIPFFFYQSLDHTYSTNNYGGSNGQIFFNISSRQIKNIHLYTTVFIDEINIHNMFNKSNESNFVSGKFGTRITLIPNLSVIAEYTITNPITYEHFQPTTFESNDYNLGSYLRDNAKELFLQLKYKPVRGLIIGISYLNALKGTEYPYTEKSNVLGLPFMDTVKWKNTTYTLSVSYEIIHDGFIFINYSMSDITGDALAIYTPQYFWNRKNTISFGMNFGF